MRCALSSHSASRSITRWTTTTATTLGANLDVIAAARDVVRGDAPDDAWVAYLLTYLPGLPRYAVSYVPNARGALGASRPVRPVRTQRGRLARVARTYPTEAPGRTCQLSTTPLCARASTSPVRVARQPAVRGSREGILLVLLVDYY